MRARAAQVKPCNRRPILRPSRHRTIEKKLLQIQLAMEDVAFRQPVSSFEIQRRQHLARNNCLWNVGRILGNLLDHAISEQFTIVVPRTLP